MIIIIPTQITCAITKKKEQNFNAGPFLIESILTTTHATVTHEHVLAEPLHHLYLLGVVNVVLLAATGNLEDISRTKDILWSCVAQRARFM